MDIQQIASRINRNFLRGNRFQVVFGVPSVMGSVPKIVNENVCAVTYPGGSYSTFDWRNAGPTIKVPYQLLQDDVNVEFYSDHQGTVASWLRRWNERIMDRTFRFNFYSDYIADVKITEFNTAGEAVSRVNLVNAYPVTVSPVQLSFENGNQVEKIGITLTYEYKREE